MAGKVIEKEMEMIITNKYNLPESLYKAITWSVKPRTGYPVTDLISPPRIVQLARRHWEEIEEDISERIWLLLGSAVHYILEKGEVSKSLKEERLEATIDGVTISGRPDLWRNNTITDYKVTSVWTVIYEPKGRTDWHAQLNLYRYLCQENGFECDKLEICAILRDWQKRKALEHDYPSIPVAMIDIPIWDDQTINSYVHDRIAAHTGAEKVLDSELPECTPEEMWQKATTYAVMKEGRKTAVRVFDGYKLAEEMMLDMNDKHYILERSGENVRCKDYCSMSKWCNQYQEGK